MGIDKNELDLILYRTLEKVKNSNYENFGLAYNSVKFTYFNFISEEYQRYDLKNHTTSDLEKALKKTIKSLMREINTNAVYPITKVELGDRMKDYISSTLHPSKANINPQSMDGLKELFKEFKVKVNELMKNVKSRPENFETGLQYEALKIIKKDTKLAQKICWFLLENENRALEDVINVFPTLELELAYRKMVTNSSISLYRSTRDGFYYSLGYTPAQEFINNQFAMKRENDDIYLKCINLFNKDNLSYELRQGFSLYNSLQEINSKKPKMKLPNGETYDVCSFYCKGKTFVSFEDYGTNKKIEFQASYNLT